MSIWMDGYKYESINKIMNQKINAKKELKLYMWPRKKEGIMIFNSNLIIYTKEERVIKNPRKKKDIHLKELTIEENGELNNFFNKYGLYILNFQLKKINYQELMLLLNEK